eukprot:334869-Amphidinium_carterae.2
MPARNLVVAVLYARGADKAGSSLRANAAGLGCFPTSRLRMQGLTNFLVLPEASTTAFLASDCLPRKRWRTTGLRGSGGSGGSGSLFTMYALSMSLCTKVAMMEPMNMEYASYPAFLMSSVSNGRPQRAKKSDDSSVSALK